MKKNVRIYRHLCALTLCVVLLLVGCAPSTAGSHTSTSADITTTTTVTSKTLHFDDSELTRDEKIKDEPLPQLREITHSVFQRDRWCGPGVYPIGMRDTNIQKGNRAVEDSGGQIWALDVEDCWVSDRYVFIQHTDYTFSLCNTQRFESYTVPLPEELYAKEKEHKAYAFQILDFCSPYVLGYASHEEEPGGRNIFLYNLNTAELSYVAESIDNPVDGGIRDGKAYFTLATYKGEEKTYENIVWRLVAYDLKEKTLTDLLTPLSTAETMQLFLHFSGHGICLEVYEPYHGGGEAQIRFYNVDGTWTTL